MLGYAGLLPQAIALLLVVSGGDQRWSALAAGFGYAALIFSFLGGLWWGIAITRPEAPRWTFAAAIAPSLIAFACYLPWVWGYPWPRPSLAVLGTCLCLSPWVDRALVLALPDAAVPEGWMALRVRLSLGLGLLTLALALTAG